MLFKTASRKLGIIIKLKMFKDFLSALVYEMLAFAAKNPERKESEMTNLRIPAVFKEYLAQAGENELAKDFKLIIQFLSDGDVKNLKLKKSKFFKALVRFLTENLAGKLDKLPSEFYLLPQKKQEEVIDKLIASESLVARALKNLLVVNSYQEIASEITELARNIADAPYLVVQSPRGMDGELKTEIRGKLNADFESGFPIFQINKNLIGGLRVFANGHSHDYSWLSRISRISKLTKGELSLKNS